MAWLSRLSPTTPFFPQIVVPMTLLGIGIGSALVPLTSAGIAGVEEKNAGAASGLVNVAQQLGGSLGLSILITVFAAANPSRAGRPGAVAPIRSVVQWNLAHDVAAALRGSAVFLALALVVIVATMRPGVPEATLDSPGIEEGDERLELVVDSTSPGPSQPAGAVRRVHGRMAGDPTLRGVERGPFTDRFGQHMATGATRQAVTGTAREAV